MFRLGRKRVPVWASWLRASRLTNSFSKVMTSQRAASWAVALASSMGAQMLSVAMETAGSVFLGVWMKSSRLCFWAAPAIIQASCPPPMIPIFLMGCC